LGQRCAHRADPLSKVFDLDGCLRSGVTDSHRQVGVEWDKHLSAETRVADSDDKSGLTVEGDNGERTIECDQAKLPFR
jgi:hypothetical protein